MIKLAMRALHRCWPGSGPEKFVIFAGRIQVNRKIFRPMQYNIGDRVRFMDFDGDGIVTAVLPHGCLEIEAEGMRMRVSAGEVVRVGAGSGEDERTLYDGNTDLSRFKQRPAPVPHSVPSGKKARRQADTMEVDLHLERIRQKYPAAREEHGRGIQEGSADSGSDSRQWPGCSPFGTASPPAGISGRDGAGSLRAALRQRGPGGEHQSVTIDAPGSDGQQHQVP